MDANYINQVARTIRQQLFALNPINVIMSWGTSKLRAIVHNKMPSLMFSVNGRLFVGEVIISLNLCSDFYEIYLKDKKGIRKVGEDLDFTQIGNFIDKTIEVGLNEEEYWAFCKQEKAKLFSGQI